MKIEKVDILVLDSGDLSLRWQPIVCRVYTDNGLYGDGEAGMAYNCGANGAYGMLKDMAQRIIGMDPLDNEVIWHKLYHTTFWGQNGGPVVFSALGAIDVALWDIKGKYFNVPVYKLLGGKKRDDLRCYASQLQYGWSDHREAMATAEDYANVSRKAVEQGYDAIKIDFFTFDKNGKNFDKTIHGCSMVEPYYRNMVEERLSAVREAVGPDVDIIMENHAYIEANAAIQLGKIAEPYNIFFFEEPCTPTPKTAKLVHDSLRIPIAHGERIYTRFQYAPYFEDGSVQVIQPDMGNTGGFTETKKICDMADTYGISVQTHVCASPISTAAALHLEAVIPNFIIHEHHVWNLHEYNKRFGKYDLQPENGRIKVPDAPGIGNELSDYCFNHYLARTTVK